MESQPHPRARCPYSLLTPPLGVQVKVRNDLDATSLMEGIPEVQASHVKEVAVHAWLGTSSSIRGNLEAAVARLAPWVPAERSTGHMGGKVQIHLHVSDEGDGREFKAALASEFPDVVVLCKEY